jgi:hypothetical protein
MESQENRLAMFARIRRHGRLRKVAFSVLPGVVFLSLLLMANGSLQAQDLPTSTPDAEGIIYVEVQPNDSLWNIAARAELTIPQLLELNGLDESVVLQPGDRLIVARVEPPATPTSDVPTPTLPPPAPTATAVRPRTAMCLLAYDDLDRNGRLDQGEPLRANVAFTIYNEREVVANYVTDGIAEPHCLEDLAPGVYHVTRSVAPDETLTTEGDWALTLAGGGVMNLAFGSYRATQQDLTPTPNQDQQLSTRLARTPAATPTTVAQGGAGSGRTTSLIIALAVAGLTLLLASAVLTYLFARKRQDGN